MNYTGLSHEEFLDKANSAAKELKGHLANAQKILKSEIQRRREMIKEGADFLSKKELKQDREELKKLESLFPEQLDRQLNRWLKAYRKAENGRNKKP